MSSRSPARKISRARANTAAGVGRRSTAAPPAIASENARVGVENGLGAAMLRQYSTGVSSETLDVICLRRYVAYMMSQRTLRSAFAALALLTALASAPAASADATWVAGWGAAQVRLGALSS